MILHIPNLIEFCVWVLDITHRSEILNIVDTPSLNHNVIKGKGGVIEIQSGPEPSIYRAKSGNLLVVSNV